MPRPYARANSDSIQSPTSSLAHTLSPRSKRSHHTAPSPRPCACTWPCAAQRPYPSGWGHYPQRSGSSGCGIFIIRPPPRAGSLGSSECRVIGILRVRDPQGAGSSGCGVGAFNDFIVQRRGQRVLVFGGHLRTPAQTCLWYITYTDACYFI